MAEHSKIEWTDATWNPITGCQIVSPGCTNCYAMKLAGTRLKHVESRKGLTQDSKAGPVWTGEVRFNESALDQPLRWKRPRMIFVCAHGDLFADGVKDEWIDQIFAVMALSPQHTFQVLTKRPERMREYVLSRMEQKPDCPIAKAAYWISFGRQRISGSGGLVARPLPNVWLGVSVEDQTRADERIPILLDTPAAVRWISAEPLLGPLHLNHDWIAPQRGCGGTHKHAGLPFTVMHGVYHESDPNKPHHHHDGRCGPRLDWVVAGGESGQGARPMHPDWVLSLRDQCAAAAVAFHFKQWGEWVSIFDRDVEDPDWRNCSVWPDQYPNGRWINLEGGHGFHGARVVFVNRIGKAAAGRHLYGRLHDDFPQVERIN